MSKSCKSEIYGNGSETFLPPNSPNQLQVSIPAEVTYIQSVPLSNTTLIQENDDQDFFDDGSDAFLMRPSFENSLAKTESKFGEYHVTGSPAQKVIPAEVKSLTLCIQI